MVGSVNRYENPADLRHRQLNLGMVRNFAFNALTTSSFFELLSHIAKYDLK
jgi:hypothetical protein